MRSEVVEELRHLLVQGVGQPPVVHSLALLNIGFPLFRDEDPDPVFFGPPDPTCNNGFIKLCSSCTKYKPESTNSSKK